MISLAGLTVVVIDHLEKVLVKNYLRRAANNPTLLRTAMPQARFCAAARKH
jgi:hypothetical protein